MIATAVLVAWFALNALAHVALIGETARFTRGGAVVALLVYAVLILLALASGGAL